MCSSRVTTRDSNFQQLAKDKKLNGEAPEGGKHSTQSGGPGMTHFRRIPKTSQFSGDGEHLFRSDKSFGMLKEVLHIFGMGSPSVAVEYFSWLTYKYPMCLIKGINKTPLLNERVISKVLLDKAAPFSSFCKLVQAVIQPLMALGIRVCMNSQNRMTHT